MLNIKTDTEMLLNNFQQDGFILLRSVLPARTINMFKHDISTLEHVFSGANPASFDLSTYQPKHASLRKEFYNLLRYIPSLSVLSSCQEIISLSRVLGLKVPIMMKSNNIRMDLPNEDEFLFHWHQDITYLLGSLNAITYWIPLTPVNKQNGTIELVPGSHHLGILPFKYVGTEPLQKSKIMSPKDIRLIEEPSDTGVHIEAEPGDIVVFSQMLLHRSATNRSNLSRWSVQIRHTDINPQFVAADCPLGDRGNIYSYPDYYNISPYNQ